MAEINVYEITSEEDYEQALIDRKKLKDLIDKTERFRMTPSTKNSQLELKNFMHRLILFWISSKKELKHIKIG